MIAPPPSSHSEKALAKSDAGAYASAKLSIDLCDAKATRFGARLQLEALAWAGPSPDYVEFRRGEQRESAGWRCVSARAPLQCEAEFRAIPLPTPTAHEEWQLVVQRGEHIEVLRTERALRDALGPVDTLAEAALWLRKAGYALPCTEGFHASGEARGPGWLLRAVSFHDVRANAEPTDSQTELRLVLVDAGGSLHILERQPFQW